MRIVDLRFGAADESRVRNSGGGFMVGGFILVVRCQLGKLGVKY